MPRIAHVANFLPAPADSGAQIRTARLGRALAAVGPVTLYCRAAEGHARTAAKHPDLAAYTEVVAHEYPAEQYARVARVFAPDAANVWTADADPLGARLAADHKSAPYDVVVCEQLFSANVARAVPGVPVVVAEHNIESAAAGMAGKPGTVVDPTVVAAYERVVWDRAALVIVPTAADAEHVRAVSRTAVRVVPNGVDASAIPFLQPSARSGREVLFVGAYFWPPNVRAAKFLAREVLPRLRADVPDASIVLCGKSPGIDVVLLKRPGVEVTGTVPAVAPYLGRAAAYANALFDGGGSSLKVLEALAAGVPLVSTAVGVRGHPVEPGVHYLPAESADDFARQVLAVFRDPAVCDPMARAGRAVAERFDWEVVGAEFAAAVRSLL